MLTRSAGLSGTHLGQRWKLLLNLGCFARSDYRSPIYEFKILQSRRLAGANRSNDFQAYLAGLAVSSQNDCPRQKTQEPSLFLRVFHFCRRLFL